MTERRASITQLKAIREKSGRLLGTPTYAFEAAGEPASGADADRILRALIALEDDPELRRSHTSLSTRRQGFRAALGLPSDPGRRGGDTTSNDQDSGGQQTWTQWAAERLGMADQTKPCASCAGSGVRPVRVSKRQVLLRVLNLGDQTNPSDKSALATASNPRLTTLEHVAGLLGTTLEGARDFLGELARRMAAEQ